MREGCGGLIDMPKPDLSGRKSPEQWVEAVAKARNTGRIANLLAKALAKRYACRWQFIDFLGMGGRESAGVVDILAIRKSGARPDAPGLKTWDLFDITLIHVKGGSVPAPTVPEIARLRLVQAKYDAKQVVLFKCCKEEKVADFFRLGEDGSWVLASAASFFGKATVPDPNAARTRHALDSSDSFLADESSSCLTAGLGRTKVTRPFDFYCD
jgi:hypothetical protein